MISTTKSKIPSYLHESKYYLNLTEEEEGTEEEITVPIFNKNLDIKNMKDFNTIYETVGFWDFPFPYEAKIFFQNNSYEIFYKYYLDYKDARIKDMFLQMVTLEILNDDQFITTFRIYKIYKINPLEYSDYYTFYGLDNKRKFLLKFPYDKNYISQETINNIEISKLKNKVDKEFKSNINDNNLKDYNLNKKELKRYYLNKEKHKEALEEYKKIKKEIENSLKIEDIINIRNLSNELFYSENWEIVLTIYLEKISDKIINLTEDIYFNLNGRSVFYYSASYNDFKTEKITKMYETRKKLIKMCYNSFKDKVSKDQGIDSLEFMSYDNKKRISKSVEHEETDGTYGIVGINFDVVITDFNIKTLYKKFENMEHNFLEKLNSFKDEDEDEDEDD